MCSSSRTPMPPGSSSGPERIDEATRLLRAAGAGVEVLVTESLEELRAGWPLHGERRVALLGGDGSLHAAANLGGTRPELALLPLGGANNVAASLGVPSDLRAAADLAANGVARPIDLIAARADSASYLAVEGVSVGFLAQARGHYNGRNSTDARAALVAALRAAAAFRPFCAQIEVDCGEGLQRVSQLFVANMPRYGPALEVAPDADFADGLLDVVTIENAGGGHYRACSLGSDAERTSRCPVSELCAPAT